VYWLSSLPICYRKEEKIKQAERNSGMATVSVAKELRCVGCRTCEVICSFIHEGECRPVLSKIKVNREPFTGATRIEIADDCDLCKGKPECIRWCPVGVLKYERE
jgi:Fe-S-cluster-containing dehydrogenase component